MNLEGNDYSHIPLDENDVHNRLVDLNLYCGYKTTYHQLLEGGGIDQRRDFLYVISKAGKSNYENALEWCSGPGVIGFELLGYNKVNHMSFMDCYKPAIDSCLETAERNNVKDKVDVYLTDKVANLNNSQKFDLVIGNPPHAFNYDQWAKNQLTHDRPTPKHFNDWDNQIRIDVDKDMQIHFEFLDNIRDKITDNCDIFISEMGDKNPVIEYARSIGYEMIATWWMRAVPSMSGEILHMRPKHSGFILT